jgi:predicted NUDIX family NTP pyrophosphohydrolase
MPAKTSAALLLHRVSPDTGAVEVLVVHPGGPFWVRKDDGAWSIPKGEYDEGEDPHAVAYREFEEEIGIAAPPGDATLLGTLKQPSGKLVTTYALAGDVDLTNFRSNTFEMEWPRGTGTRREFPEVDRAQWFAIAHARVKLLKGHVPFLDRLVEHLREQGVTVDEGSAPETR